MEPEINVDQKNNGKSFKRREKKFHNRSLSNLPDLRSIRKEFQIEIPVKRAESIVETPALKLISLLQRFFFCLFFN